MKRSQAMSMKKRRQSSIVNAGHDLQLPVGGRKASIVSAREVDRALSSMSRGIVAQPSIHVEDTGSDHPRPSLHFDNYWLTCVMMNTSCNPVR
jgi:hypothetical protein